MRLAQHGITASTETVGDSYDNALAENINGSYKNELIHTRRWNDVVEVKPRRSLGRHGGTRRGSTKA